VREEAAAFYEDVQEKTITGRSARNARTHCGKAGPVRLPSDALTEEQWKERNGECRIYRRKASEQDFVGRGHGRAEPVSNMERLK